MTAIARTDVDFVFGLSAEASAAQGEEMRQALSPFPGLHVPVRPYGRELHGGLIFPIAAEGRPCDALPATMAEKSRPLLSQIIDVFRNELKRVRELNPC
ncbi:MAG: hypothetical protein R3D69_04800 [Xanthobacteraceae bacterium]